MIRVVFILLVTLFVISLAAVVVTLLCLLPVAIDINPSNATSASQIGALGDTFGGFFNPIFSALAFGIIALSLHVQREELKAQVEQLEGSRKAQEETLKIELSLRLSQNAQDEIDKISHRSEDLDLYHHISKGLVEKHEIQKLGLLGGSVAHYILQDKVELGLCFGPIIELLICAEYGISLDSPNDWRVKEMKRAKEKIDMYQMVMAII